MIRVYMTAYDEGTTIRGPCRTANPAVDLAVLLADLTRVGPISVAYE